MHTKFPGRNTQKKGTTWKEDNINRTYKQQEGRGVEGTHLTENEDNYKALVSTLLRAVTKVFCTCGKSLNHSAHM